MVRIAPVNLAFNPNLLWFDAGNLNIEVGQNVIVNTARGVEFGKMVKEVFDATDADIERLKSPLQSVVRVANEQDAEKNEKLEQKAKEALVTFRELAAETCKTMHPVSVEYLFDGNKAVFYFEAPKRLDFRELVRKLTHALHVRVDMRQITVRDRARIVGGFGHCGEELCCKRFGCGFSPVSIRMAKEQNLTLNQQKISGMCGRLMCCLRYEYEAYKDFNARCPKVESKIKTPDGEGEVVSINVPKETVSVKVGDKSAVEVPLASFDAPTGTSKRPNVIGEEAWKEACAPKITESPELIVSAFSGTQISGGGKLADREKTRQRNAKVVKNKAKRKNAQQKQKAAGKNKRKRSNRKPKGAKNNGNGNKNTNLKAAKNEFNNNHSSKKSSGRKVRRRSIKLNTTSSSKNSSKGSQERRKSANASQNRQKASGSAQKTAKYPGQKSGRAQRRQSGQQKNNSKK